MSTQCSWPVCEEAAEFVDRLYSSFAAANPSLVDLAQRFRSVAGVELRYIVDHWVLPPDDSVEVELVQLGFTLEEQPEGDIAWGHREARLPRIRFKSSAASPRMAIHVEDPALFATANGLAFDATHGDPDAAYQCAHLPLPAGELTVVARRGYAGFAPGRWHESDVERVREVRAAFDGRDRTGDDAAVIARAAEVVADGIHRLGRDRAVEEFFAAERRYWMSRNAAGRAQYALQQSIGIGWANHDHHTFRCRRDSFPELLGLWDLMGFECRERFYAGAEAGWGAQVLDHPVCPVVIFSDLDMAPDEIDVDFRTVRLPDQDSLGTIGLWTELHGSSIGMAGLHHLEAEFDFPEAERALSGAGIGTMAPFTDLPMLKQAFTTAEVWPVEEHRLAALVARGAITDDQAAQFREHGATGSHLEILERRHGYKGFNQTGINEIIRKTDARLAAGVSA